MSDTMAMARESWIDVYGLGHDRAKFIEALKHFEFLVRADEQEKYKWDIHSCGPNCKRYGCVAMREAVVAEREACAKVADLAEPYQAADLIRARGNT